jgi:LCP family protein required for cell wall assembly
MDHNEPGGRQQPRWPAQPPAGGGGGGRFGAGRGRWRRRGEKWSLRKKLVVWGCSALAGVIVLVVAGLGLAWHHLNGNIKTEDAQLRQSDVNGKQDILFIGSDSRAGANQALGGGDVGGARSDTAMVFDAPADRRRGTEVSIPRDSMVQIPDCDSANGQTVSANYGMFNSAFDEGGAPCTVKTVESLTGLSLTHYIAIDFEGVVGVVNALGGVRVCVTQAIDDQDSGLKIPAGVTTLNGDQALAFVRLRHSVGDGSDLERIQRQQYFLDQLERQMRNAGLLTDPIKLYKVLDAATQSLTTDPGLGTVTDLYNLAQTLNRIPNGKMTYATVPNEPYPDNPDRVVWSEPAAATLWNGLISEPDTAGASNSATAAALGAGLHDALDSTPFASAAQQALSRFEGVMKLVLMADAPTDSGDGASGAGSGSDANAAAASGSPGAGTTMPGGANVGTCAVP